jgi:hypothetical protein
MAYERIFKPCALLCQRIDVGRPDDWVSVAPQRAGRLVVSKEEYDVGAIVGEQPRRSQKTYEKQ